MATITIGYSYNQEDVIEEHLEKAGLKPHWTEGEPTANHPDGKILRIGEVEGWENVKLIKTRSSRVPKRVSEGVYDMGFVGTDVLSDHFLPNLEIKGRFDHGRINGQGSSYLELVATKNSKINSVSDIEPGTIIHTEVPHLTRTFLKEKGLKTALYWNTQTKADFKERLVRTGRVGVELSPGGVAQDLQPDEILALVTESGDTREYYNLKSIAKICDIDSLLIVNEGSLIDPEKEEAINEITQRLIDSYISGESEGTINHRESFTRKAFESAETQGFHGKER